jgi:DNA-binding response OmpR family regulator
MPTSQAPAKADEVVKVLLVSCLPETQLSLRPIFDHFNWLLHDVSTCGEALAYLRGNSGAAVICDRDLPDGDWKLMLSTFDSLPMPPSLIVTSRLADEELWAEVLNLGGYDVLAQPFDAQEVYHVVSLACDAQKRRGQGSGQYAKAAPALIKVQASSL